MHTTFSSVIASSSSVGMSFSGIFSDGQYILNKLHKEQLTHLYTYGCDMPASRLAKACSDLVHDHTTSSSYRPFGVRMCLFSCKGSSGSISLYEIDPYGYCHDCEAVCLGEIETPTHTVRGHSDVIYHNWLQLCFFVTPVRGITARPVIEDMHKLEVEVSPHNHKTSLSQT